MKTIINLTPHSIVLMDQNESPVKVIESSGIARAKQENELTGQVNGYPLRKVKFGSTIDLPAPQENTLYVVSQITANAAKNEGRKDVVITDQEVRSEKGHIIGCKGFATV